MNVSQRILQKYTFVVTVREARIFFIQCMVNMLLPIPQNLSISQSFYYE